MSNDPFADEVRRNVQAGKSPKRSTRRGRAVAWIVLTVCAAVTSVALALIAQALVH